MKTVGRGDTANDFRNKSKWLLQAWSAQTPPNMIHGQSPVSFSQRRLAHIVTSETVRTAGGGEGGKSLARVNLTWWSNRFDASGTTHVSSTITAVSRYRIVELVNRAGVERDTQTQAAAQPFLFPSGPGNKIGKLERELPRQMDIGKHEIKAITPCILCDKIVAERPAQLCDRAEKMLNESRHLILAQFTEAHRVSEQNGDDSRDKFLRVLGSGRRVVVGV